MDGKVTTRLKSARPKAASTAKSLPIGMTIYEAIRHDIITLALKPGQKVSEQALVNRYGVGKAPVRTAVARLAQEGLIEGEPRGGRYVSAVSLRDMQDLYAMRRLLCPEAAAQAAGAATEALAQRTAEVLAIDFSSEDPERVLTFCMANRNFIVEMARCSGNQLLVQTVSAIEDRAVRIIFLNSVALPRVEVFRAQYQDIWDAIVRGDGAGARQATERALAESERAAVQAVLKLPQLQTVNLGR